MKTENLKQKNLLKILKDVHNTKIIRCKKN